MNQGGMEHFPCKPKTDETNIQRIRHAGHSKRCALREKALPFDEL
jgi:hypothetical protein